MAASSCCATGIDLFGILPLRPFPRRQDRSHAGTLIEIEYEVNRPVVFRPQMAREAVEPPHRMWPLSSSVGEADKAIADAAVRIERAYTMPDRHHNAMEPHATLAVWTTTAR